MLDKSFDFKLPFLRDARDGTDYPITEVRLLTSFRQWLRFPLLFDTGATDIVLCPKYAAAFPVVTKWSSVETAGEATSRKDIPITTSQIEIFGHVEDCEILLMDIPFNPLYSGLLGRKAFRAFGFGFWESARELYVTAKP